MIDYSHINTDPEFRIMNPPRSKNEYVKYKRELMKNGCQDAVYLWNNIILAGYDTYEICKEHNITFQKFRLEFAYREKAIVWICQHYLNTMSLSETMKKYLLGKQYETEKRIREQELHKNPTRKQPGYIYSIAKRIGSQYHLSQSAIYKYGVFSHSIDTIASKEPELATKVLLDTLKISQENLRDLSRLPKENIQSVNKNLSDRNVEHIAYCDIRHELMWKRLPTPTSKPTIDLEQSNIPIKQLPKYNPDSSISSLVLTIPSWISSIERTQKNADFNKITGYAKGKLYYQLLQLRRTIDRMINIIKEDYNG